MNAKTAELLKRTFDFGVSTLKFLRKLPKDKIYSVITYQLAKAATSVGANYEEAQGAESKKDFSHKIGIALKEIRESNYWFRILNEILQDSQSNSELIKLLDESNQLKQIFSSIKISSSKKY